MLVCTEVLMISIYMLIHKFVFVEFDEVVLIDLNLIYILYFISVNTSICCCDGGIQFLYLIDVKLVTLTMCKFLINFKISSNFFLTLVLLRSFLANGFLIFFTCLIVNIVKFLCSFGIFCSCFCIQLLII